MSAFSGALAAALRELLSSTLGVPEEGVREAPLPELVRALQREWEGLLEGLVSGEGGVEWNFFAFFAVSLDARTRVCVVPSLASPLVYRLTQLMGSASAGGEVWVCVFTRACVCFSECCLSCVLFCYSSVRCQRGVLLSLVFRAGRLSCGATFRPCAFVSVVIFIVSPSGSCRCVP